MGGAPNVEAYAPGDHCYIGAGAFESPRSLAAYLQDLSHDETAYARYFDWRSHPLRPAFVTQMDLASEEVVLRLARHIARRLQAHPRPQDAGASQRPFGWLGYARPSPASPAPLGRLNASVVRAYSAHRGLEPNWRYKAT
ncbi:MULTISPECIES: glycosyltransferase family 10 domain-containing protein [Pseudomonas]|uniref:glycosyltransferase family 10 domain-containing protein n=1 Tax=Pseudomonas TaxID=286 RepID=UPI0035E3CF3A